MYLDLEEPLSNNDNLKKILHCHICCKVFMIPPSYKGVTPKLCNKCYKEKIKLRVNNNSIDNNNSVNELAISNENLNNNNLPQINYDSIILNDKEIKNNNLTLKNNKFKNVSLLFYKIIEKVTTFLCFLFNLITLKFIKNKTIYYLIKQQKIKDKLNKDKLKKDNINLNSKSKGKKRKERRELLKQYYQDNLKKYQNQVGDLNQCILKQDKYNQVQREILCDEVLNLRKDKDKSILRFFEVNDKLKVMNNLYLKEKNKNIISCKISVNNLKKLVNSSNLQNGNIDKDKKEIDNVCNICLTNNKQLAFNCGHLCCCYSCGLHLLESNKQDPKCPICRVGISSIFRIY